MASATRAEPISDEELVVLSVPHREGIALCGNRLKFVLRFSGDPSTYELKKSDLHLPLRALTSTSHDGTRVFWLGPTEWLIVGKPELRDLLVSLITSALEDEYYALIDVSSQYVEISVTGSHARCVLRSFTPLDLDIGSFPEGQVARTVFGKTEVILSLEREPSDFRLFADRSYAYYVLRLLCIAGAEFEMGLCTDIVQLELGQ